MAKRRLTRRQQWRIKKIQDERIKRAERKNHAENHSAEQSLNDAQLGPEQQGRVIAHYGNQVEVIPLDPTALTDNNSPGYSKHSNSPNHSNYPSYRCHLRTNIAAIVTGDQVIWRTAIGAEKASNTGVVVALMPRQSEFSRPDTHGQLRPVAANIDQIFIVAAARPLTPQGLIDRYLVATETLGIATLLLVNKADLPQHLPQQQELAETIALYKNIDYPVLTTSTKSDNGLEHLLMQLKGHTSVFVGQSGVGKSSLVNALLPSSNARVGALSQATGKGAHTTTTAELFLLPEGGAIIDSPGIREFGLWHIDEQQLCEGFREFRPYIGQCKFRDCRHHEEPGCALKLAVSNGKIHPRRFASFQQIANSL